MTKFTIILTFAFLAQLIPTSCSSPSSSLSSTSKPIFRLPATVSHKSRAPLRSPNRDAVAAAVVDPTAVGKEKMDQSPMLIFQGWIQLGLPPQNLLVEFNTASLGFCVTGRDCQGKFCKGTNFFNYTRNLFDKVASLTYKEDSPARYFNSTQWPAYGNGTYGTDYFLLASGVTTYQGISVVVLDSLGAGFKYRSVDGIFGLGIHRKGFDDGGKSALSQLLAAVNEPIFTVWMHGVSDAWTDGAGQITFGALDDEHCDSPWNFVSLPDNMWGWSFSDVTVRQGDDTSVSHCGAEEKSCAGYGVSFFSDWPYLYGPEDFVVAVAKRANATYSEPLDFYVDCAKRDTLPPIEFIFNGTVYPVPASSYVIMMPGGSCKLAIGTWEEGVEKNWILGAPFFRTYCVAHDSGKRRIGFAKSKPAGGEKNGAGVISPIAILVVMMVALVGWVMG